MKVEKNTKKLYDNQANDWSRNEPILLSDYSARPFVLDLCEPLKNLNVLDIGCGEGYVGRQILKRGAQHVDGIDISDNMIANAKQIQENENIQNATYKAMDVSDFKADKKEKYDLIIAMFLFNYLTIEETQATMEKAIQLLKPGGYLIFSVPHPLLAYLKKDKYPFYFEVSGGYFSARNTLFPGEIWRRDGVPVNVQCVHKTIQDYFSCLKNANFKALPEVYELHITKDHINLDEKFFGPLEDLPLHMAFKIQKV
jgi:2-polyprenyl-3-methyl-5-hydroxy-6-metoxy-1,4-benzoquinol methylase